MSITDRPRRMSAAEALKLLQSIAEDQSDDEGADSLTEDYDDIDDLFQVTDEESDGDEASSDDSYDMNHGEGTSNGEQEDQPSSSGSTVAQVDKLLSKSGTVWTRIESNTEPAVRTAMQNIVRCKPGPVSAATRKIDVDSKYSALSLLIDEKMLRHILKCTVAEGRRVLGEWDMTLEELEKVIGLLYARGVLGCANVPVDQLWSKTWGVQLFTDTMSRNRFKEIMRFIRFDLRSERLQRLQHDKFALMSEVWNDFASNCSRYYIPSCELTVDEQLFPTKSRCPFTQYMGSKPDKYGIKFWLLAEVESKYCCAARPYLGKDDRRPANVSLASHVVTTLLNDAAHQKENNTSCMQQL